MLLALPLALVLLGATEIELPWVFTDHMVLQRETILPVWGSAASGAEVRVTFAGNSAVTTADESGEWLLHLPAMRASFEGREMIVAAADSEIRIANVLVGDVWLCAGQSNMDFRLTDAIGGPDAAAAMHQAAPLRFCDRTGSPGGDRRRLMPDLLEQISPEGYYSGSWTTATPESAGSFSAVGFYFGRAVADELQVPIGLIDVSVGGSSTEGWVPLHRLRADPAVASLAEDFLSSPLTHPFIRERASFQIGEWSGPRPQHFFEPGFLFESAIEPLPPFALRGVIWYQGESNAHLPGVADRLFRMMVEEWRRAWHRQDLPVHFVQLPGMSRPTWPAFREVQAGWLDIPHTGMAVAIDVGHPTDVHPKDKQPVGERLARVALARTYGREVQAEGPQLSGVRADGDRLVLELQNASGLTWAGDQEPAGFEVAGGDRRFYPARAVLRGTSVVLDSPEVDAPVDARYAWAPFPACSLVNGVPLPAAPFRTHDGELHAIASDRHPGISPRPPTRVFVLTGQSNSLGTTADPADENKEPTAHPADEFIRFFWSNRSTRAGEGAAVLIGDSGGRVTTLRAQQGEGANPLFWGPEIGFGRSLYEAGEREFLIVKASRAGGSNGFWSKGSEDDHMYRHVVETVESALAVLRPGEPFEIAALLYLQGESDDASEAEAAGERLIELRNNLRRDLPRAKRMRLLVGGIAAEGENRDLVRRTQQEAAAQDTLAAYFSTLDLRPGLYDALHFDRAAKIIIGQRFAEAWYSLGGPRALRSGSSPTIAITGATVIDSGWDATGKSDVAGATVLIRDGFIVAVEAPTSVEIPTDAVRIDASGMFIVPGLVDAFAAFNHQGYANAYLHEGITTVVAVSGGRRGDLFRGADPSPRVVPLEGIGTDPMSLDELLSGLDGLAADGVGVALLMYGISAEQLGPVASRAHELRMATVGELGMTRYQDGVGAGLDAVVHTTRYSLGLAPEDVRLAVAAEPFSNDLESPKWRYYESLGELAASTEDVREYGAMFARSGVALIPTFSLLALDRVPTPETWSKDVAKLVRPSDINRPADPVTGKHTEPEEVLAAYARVAQAQDRLESVFVSAGARYVAGSGTDVWGTMPGISLHEELRALVRAGLTPRQALAAATSQPASVLRLGRQGLIAPGHRADLLVLAQDPRRGVDALRSIDVLVVNGRIVDRAALLELEETDGD